MMMMMVLETDTQSLVIKVGGDGGGFITTRSQTALVRHNGSYIVCFLWPAIPSIHPTPEQLFCGVDQTMRNDDAVQVGVSSLRLLGIGAWLCLAGKWDSVNDCWLAGSLVCWRMMSSNSIPARKRRRGRPHRILKRQLRQHKLEDMPKSCGGCGSIIDNFEGQMV